MLFLSGGGYEKTRIRGAVSRDRVEREYARKAAKTGDLEPFCQIAIWWLEQRLARMPA